MSGSESEKHWREHIGGLVFVALMFIGAGIGLAFNRPDVGGAIGMGVGFLVMAMLRYYRIKPAERYISIRSIYGSLILGTIGILLIAIGVLLLMGLEIYMKYVGAFASIVLGLIFLALAFKIIRA